jgi:S-formylglutathione hydrolase FrmB
VLLSLASGLSAAAHEDGAADVAEPCEPARIPFDEEDLGLTGTWAADDGGVYYIRQLGDEIWWNGMSGREGPSSDLGRDLDNVAHGTLKGIVLGLDVADVPRGNVWGQGHLSIRAEEDEDGNLRLRRISGDFGGTIFTPCTPTPRVVDSFVLPYTYTVPFGQATATWAGVPDQDVLRSPDVPDSGVTTWLIGPGWAAHCGLSGPLEPLGEGPEGFIAYLRGLPDVEVSEPESIRVDGERGLSVDLTSSPTAPGCGGDRHVRLWKQGDREAGQNAGATTRVEAIEVGGQTVAFEIWSPLLTAWAPKAQAIIDSVRFDRDLAKVEAIGETADDGARIVDVDALDTRTRDLTIESSSVGYVRTRLLLPEGFAEGADTTWPVLYLLHGAFDDYTSWTRETDVAELGDLSDVLVVMPEAGSFGWYSDWWHDGNGGVPAWETFHVDELTQLVERNWQAGQDRVVAGLSMGGFGAMSYAARHPGMFRAAASYSGVLDTVGSDFEGEPAMWGDKTAQADIWESHNPTSLADELEGTPLYVSWGNGQFGPLDEPGWDDDGLEAWVAPQNEAFTARLRDLGIDATIDDYGDGLHTWPYWERGLHESLPMLREALGLR